MKLLRSLDGKTVLIWALGLLVGWGWVLLYLPPAWSAGILAVGALLLLLLWWKLPRREAPTPKKAPFFLKANLPPSEPPQPQPHPAP